MSYLSERVMLRTAIEGIRKLLLTLEQDEQFEQLTTLIKDFIEQVANELHTLMSKLSLENTKR